MEDTTAVDAFSTAAGGQVQMGVQGKGGQGVGVPFPVAPVPNPSTGSHFALDSVAIEPSSVRT